MKSFHDLYPSKVNEKINADAKFKTWDAKQKTAVAEASKRSTEFDAANALSMAFFFGEKLPTRFFVTQKL